jgi:DNA repair protein RadC
MSQDHSEHNSIRNWPLDDRPREKLLKFGEKQLSNSELLAILLRTGTQGESALDIGRKIIEKFKTFRNMSHTDSREWKSFRGLGPAKLAQIRAAIEIGRRFREDELRETQPQIKSSRELVEILMPSMRDLKIEVFKAVYLNSQNRIIAIEEISRGTVNRASPFIREIFHKALAHFAAAVICVHNHPSGDVTPSPEDRQFTRDLSEAGRVLSVKLLDHMIIGDNRYFSFSDSGQLARL